MEPTKNKGEYAERPAFEMTGVVIASQMGQITYEMILRCFAVANQAGRSYEFSPAHWESDCTCLALASLTRTLGLAKSSRKRWLCSVKRRSFSSDIDCCHIYQYNWGIIVGF